MALPGIHLARVDRRYAPAQTYQPLRRALDADVGRAEIAHMLCRHRRSQPVQQFHSLARHTPQEALGAVPDPSCTPSIMNSLVSSPRQEWLDS
jgi:hypothetical protein